MRPGDAAEVADLFATRDFPSSVMSRRSRSGHRSVRSRRADGSHQNAHRCWVRRTHSASSAAWPWTRGEREMSVLVVARQRLRVRPITPRIVRGVLRSVPLSALTAPRAERAPLARGQSPAPLARIARNRRDNRQHSTDEPETLLHLADDKRRRTEPITRPCGSRRREGPGQGEDPGPRGAVSPVPVRAGATSVASPSLSGFWMADTARHLGTGDDLPATPAISRPRRVRRSPRAARAADPRTPSCARGRARRRRARRRRSSRRTGRRR